MADTLLDIVKRVLRATGQNPSKTAFADTDDTQYIVDRINEALQKLYSQNPTQVDTDGTVTLAASTRTVSAPSDQDVSKIYPWSWRIDQSAGDKPLTFVTKEFIVGRFPLYETLEASFPQYVYIDGGDIAFYPLLTAGSTSLPIQFSYPAMNARLSSTTATFPWVDNSDEMQYLELFATGKYELYKGLGQPVVTIGLANSTWARLIARYAKNKRVGFTSYRKYP